MSMWSQIKGTLGRFKRNGFRFGNPENDWFIVLLIFFLFTGALFFVSNYAQGIIARDEAAEDLDVSSYEKEDFLDVKVLNQVIDLYATKKKEMDAIRANPPTLVDPSL